MQAYVNGIVTIGNPIFINDPTDANGFWTATSYSTDPTNGIFMYLNEGTSGTALKNSSGAYLCVSD